MDFKKLSLSGITAAMAFSHATTLYAQEKKPNIVFLLADDQTSYSVGCYGNKDVKTPHMDQLGKDGLIFNNHYDTTSICMASRANILTGMYEYKHGCNFDHGPLQQQTWDKTYPILLRKAGYFTAFAGKLGLNGYDEKSKSDFDMWAVGLGQSSYDTKKIPGLAKYVDKYPHSTLAYGAFGQDVIKEAVKAKKPFCLSISFKAPHRPTTPDPRFNDIYANTTFTKPANFGRKHAEHLSPQSKKGRQYPRFSDWGYDTKYNEVMRIYHQQVYGIDVALGMVRDELKRQGVEGNTVVIYTSDNGFLCGSHGYGSKVLPYEESTRAPLMIYDPRHAVSGKELRTDALTGNIDMMPTILALAGIPMPDGIDGKSVLPLLDNPKAGSVRDSLALMNTFPPIATSYLSVVTNEWKYTYWWCETDGMKATEELFNTKNDPLELKNLATDPESKAALKKMRTLYDLQLKNWKEEGVDHNDYTKYKTLFDRHIPWSEKEPLAQSKPKKTKDKTKKTKKDKKAKK